MTKLLLLLPMLLASCGSLFNPGPDRIPIDSIPSGAAVLLDGVATGQVTPCSILVERKAGGMVTVELAGYAPQTSRIDTVINEAGVLNMAGLLLAPVFGAIDAAAGNWTIWESLPVFRLASMPMPMPDPTR